MEHSLTNVALKLVLRHEFAGGGIGTVTRNQWGTYLGEGFVGTLCHDMSYTFGVVALSLSTRNEMFIDANLFSLVGYTRFLRDVSESYWNYRKFL